MYVRCEKEYFPFSKLRGALDALAAWLYTAFSKLVNLELL